MTPTRSTSRHLAASTLTAVALAAGTSAQAGPVNVMNFAGTTLIGVDGIEFNNQTYNVRFVDNTCQAVFNGCNSNTNSFLFTTEAAAISASTALGNAVFASALPGAVDGVTLNSQGVAVLTPWGFNAGGFALNSGLVIKPTTNTNAFLDGPFSLSNVTYAIAPNAQLASLASLTYAKWSLGTAAPSANDVPEPGSLALTAVGLGAAFLAAGKTRRRRTA